MADYSLKRRSAVQRTVALKDGANAAINLTGATVDFLFSRAPDAAPMLDRTLVLEAAAATAGVVTFTLSADETNFVGPAYAEFRVTRGALVEFVPGDKYVEFYFYDSLEADG